MVERMNEFPVRMARPDPATSPLRLQIFMCVLMMLAAGVLALAMDASVAARQWHLHRTIVSGDVFEFRAHAVLMSHLADHAAAAAADHLPYPPPFLCLIVPMSWLSPLSGYIAWIMAANLLLVLTARALGLCWWAIALGLISPANLYCMTMGQTGIFVAVCLLTSLGLAEAMPVLAGVAAGCLIIKPQFALLLPVCFLAARNWRAFFSAAATVLILCTVTTLLFTPEVWRVYFGHQAGGGTALMRAHWPQPFQVTMVTLFMMCRSLGAGLRLSDFIQVIASLVAAIGAWWLWARGARIDRWVRLAATLILVVLATPYAYIYDLPALALALTACAASRRPGGLMALALFWAFTSLYGFFSTFWFLTGPIWLLICLAMLGPGLRRSRIET
jgi:hypothetical protein